MIRTKSIYTVEFNRGYANSSIDVRLKGKKGTISLFKGIIAHCSNRLSEKEIETAIKILKGKKELMLKECNFPAVYGNMLNELIEVQRVRYGDKKDKKRKLGYSVSIGKLEEILGSYYKIKNVHVSSIDVGCDRVNADYLYTRTDLESDYRYLVLSFREGEKEDETF